MDGTYVKVAGRWVYLYRTIDQSSMSSSHRNGSLGHSPVFTRALEHSPCPDEVSTD
jgi:transposase-like protein